MVPRTGSAVSPAFRLANFYFWYFAFIGVFGTYIALYLHALGYSAGEIALLMSLQQIVRIVTPFFWGWLADRLHRRTAIIRATLVLATASFALLFVVSGYAAMSIAFVLMYSFWSAALPLFEASVLTAVDGDSGRYARIRLWGSVGFIVTVTMAGWVLDRLAMSSLLWMVLAMLVMATVSAWMIPENEPRSTGSVGGQSAMPILRRPEVMGLFAACFLMMATQSANFIFYSIFMVENGHSKSTVGILWSLGVIAEIAIFVFLPRINTRFTPQSLFAFSFFVTAFRYLLVAWFPASLTLQLIAQIGHAFTYGTWHAATMAMLHQWFPAQLGARGQAILASFAFGLGGALGGIGAGVAWESLGAAWMFTAMSALMFVAYGISCRWVGATRL